MAMITVGKENSTAIDLYYEDHGAATPVVLIHDNYDVNGGKLVSDRGNLQCVEDIAKNTVPTLISHGDADRILPPDATSRSQAKMIKHVKFAEIAGGPHGLCWTHADRVNAELVPFVE
jgi:pimeloyl-ACP methyl ester carboxylesterase